MGKLDQRMVREPVVYVCRLPALALVVNLGVPGLLTKPVPAPNQAHEFGSPQKRFEQVTRWHCNGQQEN